MEDIKIILHYVYITVKKTEQLLLHALVHAREKHSQQMKVETVNFGSEEKDFRTLNMALNY